MRQRIELVLGLAVVIGLVSFVNPVDLQTVFGALIALVIFVLVLGVVALLPLPGAILLRRIAPSASGIFHFCASMIGGMLLLFLLLKVTETPRIETDGESTIIRHAGPGLDASRKLFYYYYAAPVMIVALGLYYTRRSRKREDVVDKKEPF